MFFALASKKDGWLVSSASIFILRLPLALVYPLLWVGPELNSPLDDNFLSSPFSPQSSQVLEARYPNPLPPSRPGLLRFPVSPRSPLVPPVRGLECL